MPARSGRLGHRAAVRPRLICNHKAQTHVTRSCYTGPTAGIKQTVLHVRLTDTQDEAIAAVESRYGGRSELVRIALDHFLEETARRDAMTEFVEAWIADAGASTADELAEMDRFFS